MAPYSSFGVIQVSKSPEIPHWFEKTFTPFLKLKSTSDTVCSLLARSYSEDLGPQKSV